MPSGRTSVEVGVLGMDVSAMGWLNDRMELSEPNGWEYDEFHVVQTINL